MNCSGLRTVWMFLFCMHTMYWHIHIHAKHIYTHTQNKTHMLVGEHGTYSLTLHWPRPHWRNWNIALRNISIITIMVVRTSRERRTNPSHRKRKRSPHIHTSNNNNNYCHLLHQQQSNYVSFILVENWNRVVGIWINWVWVGIVTIQFCTSMLCLPHHTCCCHHGILLRVVVLLLLRRWQRWMRHL